MKVAEKNTIRYKALKRIQRLRSAVILRQDVQDLGTDRQVSRALKALVEEGFVVKIGYGVYAKAKKSTLTNDQYLPGGFLTIGREALNRLGVEWEISEAEKQYGLGNTQQIPANPPTKLNTRFRRHLSYRGREMRFE
jgi:hypothetical protein